MSNATPQNVSKLGNLLTNLARRLRIEADLLKVEGEGFIETAALLIEAAERLGEVMPALERAHVHGYDEGRSDGVLERQGERRIGRKAAWQDYLAMEFSK